jgi:2-polyprenyl-3-methyl-5-hydroxy-6-metoxy-1,4-benzoquinol methylase
VPFLADSLTCGGVNWTPKSADGIVTRMAFNSETENAGLGDYGWTEQVTCSTGYLNKCILPILRRRGSSKILDLGCGNASLTREIRRVGLDVVGIDADAKGIEIARASCPDVIFICRKLEDGPPAGFEGAFDTVVSTEVIEHLYRPEDLMKFAGAVLRKHGLLIVSTPYHGYLKNLAIAITNSWDRHHDPLWNGGHIKFWSRASLSKLISQSGFHEVEFVGAGRVPYLWKSMIMVAEKE